VQKCYSTNNGNVRSLGVDTEVSDAGMETTESNDCREVSKKDGDVNGVLAAICERVRFFCKDG